MCLSQIKFKIKKLILKSYKLVIEESNIVELEIIERIGYGISILENMYFVISTGKEINNQNYVFPADWVQQALKILTESLFKFKNDLVQTEISKITQDDIDSIIAEISNINDYSKDKINTSYFNIFKVLYERVLVWKDRIISELMKIKVVKLYTDTSFNPEWLLSGPKSFIGEIIWNKMSNIEKSDLEDVIKCLTVQALTPTAMVIMRATESTLRTYYKNITATESPQDAMGEILKILEKNPDADKRLLEQFYYLKEIRNKYQHPDYISNQDEVESIFRELINIIKRVYA